MPAASKFNVLITNRLPIEPHDILKRGRFHVVCCDGSAKLLRSRIRTADGLVAMLNDRIDRDLLSRARRLKVVSLMAAGYDNVDLDYCRSNGITVTNTPGVLTETTADLVWALILACCRRIVEADKFMRRGKFRGWRPDLFTGMDVYGKTLGVIGAGKIGSAVIRRAQGFRMKILYNNRRRDAALERSTGAVFAPLPKLLAAADIISLNCPLTSETRHLIGENEFRRMKKGAILINASRGKVVDERALIRNLRSGRIAAAGLDVYHDEPKISKELRMLSNVVLLPHIGSASVETRARMARIALQNAARALLGRRPLHTV